MNIRWWPMNLRWWPMNLSCFWQQQQVPTISPWLLHNTHGAESIIRHRYYSICLIDKPVWTPPCLKLPTQALAQFSTRDDHWVHCLDGSMAGHTISISDFSPGIFFSKEKKQPLWGAAPSPRLSLKIRCAIWSFDNGCAQGSVQYWVDLRMRARVWPFLTDARNGSLRNRCTQSWAYHPDARNLHDGCVQPL